jgi:hypothetical protein
MSVNRVSTSEVATYLTCKRRWMYAHHPSYGLEPRSLGVALTRGFVGHQALEIYYKALMNSESYEDAEKAAIDFVISKSLNALTMSDGEKTKMFAELGNLLKAYFLHTRGFLNDYEIVGVEKLVIVPLPQSEIEFAGRIDLVLRIRNGPKAGYVIPEDHKFTYDFWSKSEVKMHPQLPNYDWALREMGYRVLEGRMNFLRYRENAVEKFAKDPKPTTKVIRENFIRDHLFAAEEITALKMLPDVSETVTRSASRFNCRYCPFIDLCYTELQGLDSSGMKEGLYRPNSYGYVDSELDID